MFWMKLFYYRAPKNFKYHNRKSLEPNYCKSYRRNPFQWIMFFFASLICAPLDCISQFQSDSICRQKPNEIYQLRPVFKLMLWPMAAHWRFCDKPSFYWLREKSSEHQFENFSREVGKISMLKNYYRRTFIILFISVFEVFDWYLRYLDIGFWF